jgi:hypothetical protein
MPGVATSLDWEKIILASARKMDEAFRIETFVSRPMVADVADRINKSLESLGLDNPNQPKIAGIAAFWIRKLKPLFQGPEATKIFLPLNEYASLIVGLGICYRDPSASMVTVIGFDPRILNDWVYSFRYHSHSPHSSIIAFETLLSNYWQLRNKKLRQHG